MTALDNQQNVTLFEERVYPSPWSLLPAILLGLGVWLVSLPILDALLSGFFGVATSLATIAAFAASAYRVAVVKSTSGSVLHVASARIPLSKLGDARVATGPEMARERGPRLDARSYRKFQSGVKSLVIVEVVDQNDPTPCWVFNVRRAERLLTALETEKAS
jgi:hypothetical protein